MSSSFNTNQIKSLPVTSRRGSCNKTGSANDSCSTSQQAQAPAAFTAPNLKMPDYRPLEVFSATAEDQHAASWSGADAVCSFYIRMKEFELGKMIQDAPKIQEKTALKNIRAGRGKRRGKWK